ncbi:GNAT family N-acetyltransferase [Massilia forsythiae]|uniref:GNAT family N-acetyltransferase n=1 Tax=Massilia forsythiae TaxID=2728020 RepID=A0A7Z2VZ06_9BURK|nr:GNAT family N-acetyltransferase [Massilia forsythiae]QJE01997.1 GNAT family N-acetyltransferase [Massilia forsythiae]
MEILVYGIDRYDDVMALMRATPGVSIRDADARETTARYLARNPGLSFLAIDAGRVIGCALCGHDGRRGYLQHVIVAPDYRGRGIADALVGRCLDGLAALGIGKTHIDVFTSNDAANRYWTRRGWRRRDDIHRYSMIRTGGANA